MYLIITGNPVDGFLFIGTFSNSEAAIEWAEQELPNSEPDWWVSKITPADEYEET